MTINPLVKLCVQMRKPRSHFLLYENDALTEKATPGSVFSLDENGLFLTAQAHRDFHLEGRTRSPGA